MSWIPVSTTLRDSPEVLKIRKLTGLGRHEIIGCLVALWSYGDSHADSEGRLKWHGIEDLSAIIDGNAEIIKAMIEVEWLTVEGEDAILTNWSKWNSKSSRSRLNNAKRVSSFRKRDTAEDDLKLESTPVGMTRKEYDEKLSVIRAKPVKLELYTEEFNTFWQAYPKHVSKKTAGQSFQKVMASGKVTLETILNAVERQKKSEQWNNAQYIPHPATWLNQERWGDVIPLTSENAPHGLKTVSKTIVERKW
jgi:hypothetical protein